MSKLSLSVYLNAYSDRNPSNTPGQNNFRWNRELNSIIVNNPTNQSATVAPGENLPLFSGLRTLLQDGTTQYSISFVGGNTYALTAVGGTLPNFRTPRATGADATTQIKTSINGPLETFTSQPGTFASFTGEIPGMVSSVTITANNAGSAGNISLIADGVSTIATLITNWNTANPGNQVTLTSGNNAQIPNASLFASFTGTIPGTATPVTITANVAGTAGNSVVLTGDGVSTINVLIANWNTANPGNTIALTLGDDGTQTPTGGSTASYM